MGLPYCRLLHSFLSKVNIGNARVTERARIGCWVLKFSKHMLVTPLGKCNFNSTFKFNRD